MLKHILLVEDDPNKLKQVTAYFEEISGLLPNNHLDIAKSFQSGLMSVLENQYDLLILDMSMPNFDKTTGEPGGEFMKFAGEDILRELYWNEITVKTIILTQYDVIGDRSLNELKDYWLQNYSPNYVDTVFYSPKETEWKNELRKLLIAHL